MTVISLAAAREERQPHWSGTVHCVGCQHEWVGVAPMGTMWLDCPNYELPKGHPKHLFGADVGDSEFSCVCGGQALTAYVRAKGQRFFLRCMACGTDQTNAVFGDAS